MFSSCGRKTGLLRGVLVFSMWSFQSCWPRRLWPGLTWGTPGCCSVEWLWLWLSVSCCFWVSVHNSEQARLLFISFFVLVLPRCRNTPLTFWNRNSVLFVLLQLCRQSKPIDRGLVSTALVTEHFSVIPLYDRTHFKEKRLTFIVEHYISDSCGYILDQSSTLGLFDEKNLKITELPFWMMTVQPN